MTNQTKTNNLNYLIDPTFSKVNRLSFKINKVGNKDDRTFSKYYTTTIEIKDFNVLIDGNFF